jgi:hypothetical protein
VRRANNLYVPIVLKSGSLKLLEPSGLVQACNGIDLPLQFGRNVDVHVDWFAVRVTPMHLGLKLQALCAPLLVPSVNSRGAPHHASKASVSEGRNRARNGRQILPVTQLPYNHRVL